MWKTYSGLKLINPIENEIEKIIKSELKLGFELKLCIGTDSQTKGNIIEYATVIVILRKGKGGRMIVKKMSSKNNITLNQRLLQEVTYSIETAYKLIHLIDKYNIGIEVHADINSDPQFKSEATFAAAKGYILGMGFEFKSKPFAFASSSCADKIVN